MNKVSVSGGVWIEVAADISALKLVQIWGQAHEHVQLEAAAEAPTAHGKRFASGETIIADRLGDIGTAGKLWARSLDSVDVAYE